MVNEKSLLKPYYLELLAVRITRKNYKELQAMDAADGVLEETSFKENLGDWFVSRPSGHELLPGDVKLIPVSEG